jgi:hypothetical protein
VTGPRVARVRVEVEMADGSTYAVESTEVNPSPPPIESKLMPYEDDKSVTLDPARITTVSWHGDDYSLIFKVPSLRSYTYFSPTAAAAPADLLSFTCPVCHMTSYHPKDVEYGYCGNCHEFTRSTCPRCGSRTRTAASCGMCREDEGRR